MDNNAYNNGFHDGYPAWSTLKQKTMPGKIHLSPLIYRPFLNMVDLSRHRFLLQGLPGRVTIMKTIIISIIIHYSPSLLTTINHHVNHY